MSLATGLKTYSIHKQKRALSQLGAEILKIREAINKLECTTTELDQLGLTWTEPELQDVIDGMQTGVDMMCNGLEAVIAAISNGTWVAD